MPRNSISGVVIGLGATAASFGLVWHMWWLAGLSMQLVLSALIARSFVRGSHRTISAAEVTATEHRWHAALDADRPTPRACELTPRNTGLAEIPA